MLSTKNGPMTPRGRAGTKKLSKQQIAERKAAREHKQSRDALERSVERWEIIQEHRQKHTQPPSHTKKKYLPYEPQKLVRHRFVKNSFVVRVFDYHERDQILRKLFNQTYKEYLASPLWKNIRKRVLKRDQHRCRKCAVTATEVHHADYRQDVLLGKDIRPLVSLCHTCHHDIEFNVLTGQKRTLQEANKALGFKA